ncbi:MAG: CDP-glycerol glycerophosphotransferase family protein [Gammaproteobacteria bacterium]|nr:CDP-glycerol glycerophosphotransferase family protein [Gammaproteobacteria bacterium]
MKHYLLFANQMYCYPILRPLQEAIIKRGDKVAWFIHNIPDMLTEADGPRLETIEAVQEYNPIAIYVPTNWIPDFFPGVKVHVFHGFDVGKRANTRQSASRIRGMFDLYCTQGPYTTEQFEAKAKKLGYFKVIETGWTMMDGLFKSKVDLREKLAIDKPIILYGSTFSPTFSSARQLADTIERLSKTGRWHWLINLHPKMDQDVVERYKNMSGENLTFFDNKQDTFPLLKAADAMLCDTSSIFLQYLLLDKPVVTFKTAIPGPHLIDIDNTSEVEKSLKYALSRPEQLMKAIRAYGDSIHPYRDGNSSERVLQATDDFIAHEADKLKPKPLNIWRKLRIRKQLKYYRLRGVKF